MADTLTLRLPRTLAHDLWDYLDDCLDGHYCDEADDGKPCLLTETIKALAKADPTEASIRKARLRWAKEAMDALYLRGESRAVEGQERLL